MHLFSNRSQRTSKCGKNISDTLGCASCATFLFLPHFDVICDLLLNRRTATWNLFVNYIISSVMHAFWLVLTYDLLEDRHSAAPCVPLFCSYHILTSFVIYYWIDTRQLGIYLLNRYWWNTRIFPFTKKSYLHRAQWRYYFYLSRVRILVSPWLLTWLANYKRASRSGTRPVLLLL